MTATKPFMLQKDALRAAPLRKVPLSVLAECIAVDGDRQALDELLAQRPVFRDSQDRCLLLGDYVYALWMSRQGDSTQILDQAYDMTMDKFSHLPDDNLSVGKVKRRGADCRYYYRAFLEWLTKSGIEGKAISHIEEEYRTAWLLQRFVIGHFHLSVLEARRNANPMVSRYTWNLDGRGAITVWLPRSMKGKERRKWLAENVENADPMRPGERERVQAIIDARIARGVLIPLERVEGTTACCSSCSSNAGLVALFAERERYPLPEFVAKEKVLAIDLQRQAIRALGAAKLKRLVLTVFGNLETNEKTEEALAREFNLSKAAFSRFAGSQWAKAWDGNGAPIPDLWLNTAHVLAHDPKFVELAKQAGVFERAGAVANSNRTLRMRKSDNE